MTVRLGINGFGRIGRSVFRILEDRRDNAAWPFHAKRSNNATLYPPLFYRPH